MASTIARQIRRIRARSSFSSSESLTSIMTSSGTLRASRRVRKLHRIDRIDGRKKLRGLFRFVRLQMSDQMESGVRQIGDGRGFALHLLHIVLAEIAQPRRVGFADRLGAEDFGDGQQADRRRIAAARGRRRARSAPGHAPAESDSWIVVTGQALLSTRYRRSPAKLSLATAVIPKDTKVLRRVSVLPDSC